MRYIAQIRKSGRLYFQTAPHDSREAAATAAFKTGPAWATTCCVNLLAR